MGVGIFLASIGLYGGGITGVLNRLADLGFFDYVLPFLLIFALIFGILTKIKIFEMNKGINVIIAFAVGLMSLQFGFVSAFFSELFPRLGIGLVIILTILILIGLFLDTEGQALNYILLAIAGIVVIIVLASSAEASYWWYSWPFLSDNLVEIFLILGVMGALVALVATANNKNTEKYIPLLRRDMG
tara:strand:- start:2374 stop:2934 length:561 start_codon:yes stop_codon:yes gene_type:complete